MPMLTFMVLLLIFFIQVTDYTHVKFLGVVLHIFVKVLGGHRP